MDPLIRSARLASSRMRLSEARADQAPAADDAARERAEIERQVRTELTVSMQQLYEAERERGHAEGYAHAMAEANAVAAEDLVKTREQLKAKVAGALSAMERAHQAALLKLDASVGEVAFAAVCQLIGETAASHVFVRGVIERMCGQLRADQVATVRLHTRDIHLLRDLSSSQELRVGTLGLKVIADDSLDLGGCVVEAASGRYDGRLEVQLRRLHEVLTAQHVPSVKE